MTLALPLHTRSDSLRGVLAMLAAMGCLILADAFIKMAAAGLPTGEAVFLRAACAAVLCVGAIASTVGLGALRHAARLRLQVRAGTDVLSTILYQTALMHMPIADATALIQFAPLAITAGAALFLGANVGWRRWLATMVGLTGVLIIVRPGSAAFNAYALLALTSIVFVAARDLLTRGIGAEVPTLVVAATSAVSVAAAAPLLALVETWVWPSPSALGLLSLSGTALLGGNFWIVVAMRHGEIAAVAPFRYSAALWAIAAGFVLWGELPDAWTWAGTGIVTAAGVYTILRESRLRMRAGADLSRTSLGRVDTAERGV